MEAAARKTTNATKEIRPIITAPPLASGFQTLYRMRPIRPRFGIEIPIFQWIPGISFMEIVK
jgi:hypothetical protein